MSNALQPAVAHSPAPWTTTTDDRAQGSLLAALLACGQREAGPRATMPALVHYWCFVACSTRQQRAQLLAAVRAALRSGKTTARSWLPIVLGEADPVLVREAVYGYIGGSAASVERRDQALDDTLDWIRRGLPLNRVAVFVTLLQLHNPSLHERLAPLRGRFTDAEAHEVCRAVATGADTATQEFIADWRALLAAGIDR